MRKKGMQKMGTNSILNVLGFLAILSISACSKTTPLEPSPKQIEVKEVQVKAPAPIVPKVDQLSLRNVEWVVLTPENVEMIFSDMQSRGEEPVLFALTSKGYENLSLNLNDIRSMIQQQQIIIGVYQSSYD